MQHFCEAWSEFGAEVEDRSLEEYLSCCQENVATARETLQGGILNEGYTAHLRGNMEYLEDVIGQIQSRQEQAQRTKEEREREEEKEIALREELRQQNDEDFWEEHDRRIGELLDSW